MNCDDSRILLAKCLNGDLSPSERAALEAHVEACPVCRKQYEELGSIQDLLRTAMAPATPASNAARSVMAALANRPPSLGRSAAWAPLRLWPVSAAAAVALVVGLSVGYGLSRTTTSGRIETPSGPAVPLQVASIQGTVLLKGASGNAWNELTRSSAFHVGDVLQASPKSEVTLSMKDGSTLVLAANSRLSLEHYNGGIRLNLSPGAMRASLNSPHPPFIVSTPSGQLEALGTEFTVSVE